MPFVDLPPIMTDVDPRDRSQVIREAIMSAWRERQAQRLRAEAEALAADEDDRREARQVLADMESLRAW
jgi:hypothetical protein